MAAVEWYFKQMQSKEHFTQDEFDSIYEQAKEIDKNRNEILKLCPNGDIFVKGRLAENDKQVVDALKEWLNSQGFSI
jgi:cytidylate kinase